MDLANFYYREVVGFSPDKTEEGITRHTIAFLEESGLTDTEILSVLVDLGSKECIRPSDLPDSVWKGSLTERDIYYCHHALHLVPPDPMVRNDGSFLEYPFYREIKARFTEKDLADYFYSAFCGRVEAHDPKKHAIQLAHSLKKYRFDGIESLDVVLFMIDEAAYQDIQVFEPFDLGSSEIVTIAVERVRKTLAERRSKGMDHIIWRTYLIDEDGAIIWNTEEKEQDHGR